MPLSWPTPGEMAKVNSNGKGNLSAVKGNVCDYSMLFTFCNCVTSSQLELCGRE